MSSAPTDRPVDRRHAIRLCMLFGACGSLLPIRLAKKAHAGILSSWDFEANSNLDAETVKARFDQINEAYAIDQAFSDEDIDFVLRYAQAAPIGASAIRQPLEANQKQGTHLCQLMGSRDATYEGNFVYRYSTVLQAGCESEVCHTITTWQEGAIYGWTHPFNRQAFGIVGICSHRESKNDSNWFATEFVDEFTGVAVGSYLRCGASITLNGAETLELHDSF